MSSIIMHTVAVISNYKPAPIYHGCDFNRRPKELRYAVSFSGCRKHCTFRCNVADPFTRRSGNYKPPLWDFDYIQSLSSEYMEERHSKRAGELMKQVKKLLEEENEVVAQLELIDELQRLGISYHFQGTIKQILSSIYSKRNKLFLEENRDLYSTALGFRLLRQRAFKVSQEVFDCFKNEKGDFKSGDIKGVLQLYEASFLLTQGETTLEMAREFSSNFLHNQLDDDDNEIDDDEQYLSLLTRHALELPIHWRPQRPNARWFIDIYEKIPSMNQLVLELAKLDFNIVQAIHQQEIKHVSRWWKQTGLAEKLPFARDDRLVECYMWTIGGLFEPEYEYLRIMATKVNVFITIIDDIFDVYGTFEEIVIFSNIIQRWDIEAIDQLPHYMQICFLALNNFVNEMAYDVLKEQRVVIIPHLRKSWADLCGAYMQEAELYTPRVNEYMKNAWISISAPVILSHAFFLIKNPVEKEVVESLYKHDNIVGRSSMLLRLANDLRTSTYEMERGDVPKSVKKGDSRENVKWMIWETWKEMNQERVADSPFSRAFIRCAVDLCRMTQYMYQNGDGHEYDIQNSQIKDRISTLLFRPIT